MTQNDDLNNMSNLFDTRIKRALKKTGDIFPETAEDFKRIEEELSLNPLTRPPKLQNPLSFLNTNQECCSFKSIDKSTEIYESSFSQAAREGGEIDEITLKKMREDRAASLKSRDKFLDNNKVGKC